MGHRHHLCPADRHRAQFTAVRGLSGRIGLGLFPSRSHGIRPGVVSWLLDAFRWGIDRLGALLTTFLIDPARHDHGG